MGAWVSGEGSGHSLCVLLGDGGLRCNLEPHFLTRELSEDYRRTRQCWHWSAGVDTGHSAGSQRSLWARHPPFSFWVWAGAGEAVGRLWSPEQPLITNQCQPTQGRILFWCVRQALGPTLSAFCPWFFIPFSLKPFYLGESYQPITFPTKPQVIRDCVQAFVAPALSPQTCWNSSPSAPWEPCASTLVYLNAIQYDCNVLCLLSVCP